MSIPKLSVEQPVLVNLLMMLIIIGGIFSYSQMARDQFPDASIESITVTTILPGASPKEIEQLLTVPLEEQIAKLDEIDEMTSISSDGSSMIVVQLESGVGNIFEKITEIQNQIELVEDFPDEAENPIVLEMKVSFETITLALVGNAPEHQVKDFIDDLKDELDLIDGIETIGITGLREREIWVECDPYRLHSYGLSLAQVAGALRRRNLNLPGGTIKMGRSEFSVRTEAEFENIDDIVNTILIQDEDNGYVYIGDVAKVTNTFEERRSLGRLDGEPSVNMIIKKDKKSNAITLVQEIKEVVADFEPRIPAGMRMKVVNDASIEIKERLDGLYQNFGLGLALCVVSFTIFIGFRAAIMVSLGIPVAMFGTFICINAYGYSVNMLVLFGLILVLGLVVDDAIVVCENIYRHLEAGMPLKKAAVLGTEEITWPVVATVLTTVAAFLPLLLMTGVLGKFMGVIPVVVTLALIASLFECLFVLPSHVAEWGASSNAKASAHKQRRWLLFLTRVYGRLIGFFLKFRYLMVAAAIASAVFSLNLAYTRMDFILFGGRDLEAFTLEIEAPSSASLAETTRIVRELEEKAMTVVDRSPEVKHVRTNVGSMTRGPMTMSAGSNMAQINFQLISLSKRERMGQEIKDEIREAVVGIPGARTMTFEDARQGPPVGKAVQVRIKGDNYDTLKVISREVQDFLRTVDGVKDIMDNFPPGKDEVQPELDLDKLSRLGLDVQTVATEIRGAFDGLEATKIHDGNEEIDVVVKYDEANRRSLASLEDMYFSSPAGMIPFGNIGRMKRTEGFSAISHHQQKRAINVLADVVEGTITSAKANQMIIEEFKDLPDRYPGYMLDFGGEFEDTQDSLASMMQAFVLAIILIYVILGGLFKSFLQPLVVMFAVPFSFVGVIFGFFLMNEPLGMFSIIGIIALTGIVVNDSLILIEFVNSRRRLGLGRRESIVQAGMARLRPIILTSITTIAGLAPMALGLFNVDQFMRPMALAIVWGLIFSTVLTLVLIPCVYAVFDDYATLVLRCPLGIEREQWRETKKAQKAAAEREKQSAIKLGTAGS